MDSPDTHDVEEVAFGKVLGEEPEGDRPGLETQAYGGVK